MNKNLFYILMILAMVFWGASWINAKILTYYINAYELIFLRMGFSFLSMIPIFFYYKLSFKVDFKSFIIILLATAILIIYSLIFFEGVKYGTAGFGGALVTTLIPINTFIILAFIQKKTISLKHSFALILGAFGVLTMLNIWQFNLNEIFSKHNIYFLLASITWPLLTIVSSKATKINGLVFTFYIYVLSSIIIGIFYINKQLFISLESFDYIFWINMFCMSILSTTFATTIYFIGVKKLGSKEVSSFIFLVPSSALIISYIFLDEHITYNTILGTICTVIAIYILNNINIIKYFR